MIVFSAGLIFAVPVPCELVGEAMGVCSVKDPDLEVLQGIPLVEYYVFWQQKGCNMLVDEMKIREAF